MPNGSHAFFRFYDPNFSIEVATMSDDEQRSLIMGPCHQWLSKQREATNTKPTQVGSDKSFPWWEVPDTVVRKLSEKDKSVLIANSVKCLGRIMPIFTSHCQSQQPKPKLHAWLQSTKLNSAP